MQKRGLLIMDTCTQYKLSDVDEWLPHLIESGRYFKFGEQEDIEHWLSLSRTINDMHQLFQLFLWNYRQMENGIYVCANGMINKIVDNESLQPENIAANGYVMNYISSGINLVNFLTSICSHESKHGFDAGNKFIEATNMLFDDNPTYAISYMLRNHSQHGQLIVSMFGDNNHNKFLCFDLYQLLNPIFVGLNSQTKRKISTLLEEMHERNDGVVRLPFADLVDSFYEIICNLYHGFLRILMPYVESCTKSAESALFEKVDNFFLDETHKMFYAFLVKPRGDDYEAHLITRLPSQLLEDVTRAAQEALDALAAAKVKA